MNDQPLPRIVRFLGTDDSPGSSCPHCGAEGRYVVRFEVEGGRRLGAMRGCLKLFPVSLIASEEARLLDKAKRLEKRGWSLNRWDLEALAAFERYYAGQLDEQEAHRVARTSAFARERERAAWRR